MTTAESSLVVCERCGRAHRWLPLAPGEVARCTQCAAVLARGHRLDVENVLALTVAALIVFVVVATTDVLAVGLGGQVERASLPQAVVATWNAGEPLIAIATAGTALVAPALWIALRLYLLIPIALHRRSPPGFGTAVRVLEWVGRWSMIEVLTVGGLISIVRLAALAQATPGPALYALVVLTVLMASIESAGIRHLWQSVS